MKNKGRTWCTLGGLGSKKKDFTTWQRVLETWNNPSHLSAELRWARHLRSKNSIPVISLPESSHFWKRAMNQILQKCLNMIFKHLLYTLVFKCDTLSPTSNKLQGSVQKLCKFYKPFQCRATHVSTESLFEASFTCNASSQYEGTKSKTFLFYISLGCYEQEHIFPTTWWFCVHDYCCRNTDFFLKCELLRYEKLLSDNIWFLTACSFSLLHGSNIFLFLVF